ncbi:uncharacterized protein [Pyrus communis]|uniref:uncharacterized protein n=1 Tax=Pyrus communis TaxID=23211 RepID=UPI0035C044A9
MGITGSDVFTEKGFTNWKKGSKNLRVHEGGVGSLHNKAIPQARDLMTQKQHIETFVIKHTDEAHNNYHTLLSASLECTRWLFGQGLPFRGHDESLKSSNMNLVRACASDTIDAISKDMEGAFFSLLVDGAHDSSTKGQIAVVLHYVNKKGEAIEKFLGVQHVSSTTSSSLEEAIERLFATTNLSMSKLRGQGYDGASNMRALVFVAKENEDVANFFINASSLVNLIGSSYAEFSSLRGISDLAKELVKTERCESYMLVYKLLTLALVLPIATASV